VSTLIEAIVRRYEQGLFDNMDRGDLSRGLWLFTLCCCFHGWFQNCAAASVWTLFWVLAASLYLFGGTCVGLLLSEYLRRYQGIVCTCGDVYLRLGFETAVEVNAFALPKPAWHPGLGYKRPHCLTLGRLSVAVDALGALLSLRRRRQEGRKGVDVIVSKVHLSGLTVVCENNLALELNFNQLRDPDFAPPGARAPEPLTRANCLAQAVRQFGQRVTAKRGLQVGEWAWVPPGCTVQSGGDWACHWNEHAHPVPAPRASGPGAGAAGGGSSWDMYTPVSARPPPLEGGAAAEGAVPTAGQGRPEPGAAGAKEAAGANGGAAGAAEGDRLRFCIRALALTDVEVHASDLVRGGSHDGEIGHAGRHRR
jgi:hypothetical protein